MSQLFYKTEKTSDTGKKMQSVIDEAKAIEANIIEFLKEIGATSKYLRNGIFNTGLLGVEFIDTPDMNLWKEEKNSQYKGFYSPRMKTKKGKNLAERFYSFGKIERSEINKVICFGQVYYRSGFSCNNEVFGFSIGCNWNHTMPEDCIEITGSEYAKISQP